MGLFQPEKGRRNQLLPLSEDRAPIRGSAISLFMSLLVSGVLFAVLLSARLGSNGRGQTVWILLLAVLGILFLSSVARLFRRIGLWTSAQSAEWPDVYVDAYPVQVGKPFRVECTWKSKLSEESRKASVSLILREKAESGSGTSLSIVFHDTPVAVCSIPPEEFRTAGGLAFIREMAVPPSAMHGFSCMHNWIFWILRVEVDLPVRPDLRQDFELRVRPS